jgi:hypothetical protein
MQETLTTGDTIMLHSIGAVFAGFVFILVTHSGTDALLETVGLFPPPGQPLYDTGLLLLASAYRGIFSIIGCYLVARLAPHHPMRHALILGGIGTLLSMAGAVAMWDYGPAWYPLSLIALSLPYAWLGGRLYEAGKRAEGGQHAHHASPD